MIFMLNSGRRGVSSWLVFEENGYNTSVLFEALDANKNVRDLPDTFSFVPRAENKQARACEKGLVS